MFLILKYPILLHTGIVCNKIRELSGRKIDGCLNPLPNPLGSNSWEAVIGSVSDCDQNDDDVNIVEKDMEKMGQQ